MAVPQTVAATTKFTNLMSSAVIRRTRPTTGPSGPPVHEGVPMSPPPERATSSPASLVLPQPPGVWHRVDVYVSDTGVGIPEEVRCHLFSELFVHGSGFAGNASI